MAFGRIKKALGMKEEGYKEHPAKCWLDKIKRAQKVKDAWKEQFRCATAYEYFEGRQRPSWVPDDEWITVNLIYSSLQAQLPALYQTDPYFYVKLAKSYTPDPNLVAAWQVRGEIRQAMLNYLKGELSLKKKARLSILDAHFAYGVFKVHLYGDVEEPENAGKEIEGEDGPLTGEDGEALRYPAQVPARKRYCLSRIHPDDHLVDEDAGPLDEDVRWHAHRIRRPLEEVKEDKRYNEDVRQRVQATELSDKDRQREQRKKGGMLERGKGSEKADTVVTWEIYDCRENQWCVVAEGTEDGFLIDPAPVPPGTEGHPFVDLRFTLRDDSWYPIPPVSQWIDPQREYGELRSKLLVHRKRFNRKYWADKNQFSDHARAGEELTEGEDGTVIWVDQVAMGIPPINPINDAPLDQQVHTELAYLRNDFSDLAASPNQRGSAQGVDSATEAGILENRTRIKEGDRLSLVADFVCDIARKLDQLVQVHIDRDQAVRVIGPEGELWRVVRQEDYEEIDGEYEYSIDVGANTPQLPEIERAQFLSFLGLLKGFPQLLLAPDLLKEVAGMFHVVNQPMLAQLRQLGMQMMSGAMPMPGQTGSAPGQPDASTMIESQNGGMAGGVANMRGGVEPNAGI